MLLKKIQLNQLITLISLLLFVTDFSAQNITQTIRGVVKDEDSQITIPGANVIIFGKKDTLGTSTDINGEFRIKNVSLGRVSIKVSFIGYEDRRFSNIEITSSKEIVLDVRIKESLINIKEFVITGKKNKAEINNEMALVSARSFSVEETKRYAGSLNDPARMVSGFAGVAQNAEGNNDIIVRGNSSRGILWRLEGIEIPNPNHFADEGSTGGPINALNSNMLANSDFFSGAFAPEYGNAFSGVFDMKLRTGNNEKREYTVSAGVVGTDITLEGPFKKSGKSSYLINYRYSSLAIFDQLKIIDFDGVPKYQDVSFKFNFPTKKIGTFSLFGLGGISSIDQQVFLDDSETTLESTSNFNARLGIIVGLNHLKIISKKSYIKSNISISSNGNDGNISEVKNENLTLVFDDELSKSVLRLSTTYNNKINARNNIQVGSILSLYTYNFTTNYYSGFFNKSINKLNEKGNTNQYQGFLSWKYRMGENITMVSGLHYSYLFLNGANSIEPRLGMNWQFHERQSLNLGFGIHSKIEPLTAYFAVNTANDGTQTVPNKNLEFGKANHYVLGYEYIVNKNLFWKMELYYQQLYNMPAENNIQSSWALLNTSGFFTDRILSNIGTGKNYGIELTLERYFAKKYFWLVTVSLFESLYKAGDGIDRSTRFNGNYVGNILFGKEFVIGAKEKNKILGISGKFTLLGAKPYTPVDLELSRSRGEEVRNDKLTFSAKGDDIFQINATIYYKRNRKKTTHEIKLDIQNANNSKARLYDYYNVATEKIEYQRPLPIIPAIYYAISF